MQAHHSGRTRLPVSPNPRRVMVVSLALVALLIAPQAALAASPSPEPSASPGPNADLQLTARALLGGHVRPGSWAAVVVEVTNAGPPVTGEIRIRSQQEGRSQYGIAVELPTEAHQRFTLYAQTQVFGSRLNVDLVTGDQVVATQQVPIRSHDAYSPIVAVVAERPEDLLPQITAALTNPNVPTPTVITLSIADLPPRVEAWAAVDRLVWQDVDASQLSDAQREALRLWLGAGGRLTILGGTTGVGTLRGFDADLLPFDPVRTVDVEPSELARLLGPLPTGAAPIPAAAGTLSRGSVLARSGGDVVAAETGFGRGAVTLVGFNPAERWIADSSAASESLWHRLLPQVFGPALNPLNLPDDSQIVFALQNLPSIDLPPVEQLLVLLAAYIALIGPINYVVLRRLDRREWAWVTIPVLVVVFAAGSYGLGATLKGSDVIVNQIAVVRAAPDTGVGIGQVYVGIYSPSRRNFDVSIPGGALLSNPTSLAMQGQAEQPLDVLLGESSSRLRNFEVGFGVLRGFRAEAPASAPRVESDLRLSRGKLQGTVTNRSEAELENVAVLFGGGVAVLPALPPGETRTIDLDTTAGDLFGSVAERIFGSTFPRDPAAARSVYTRRAVLDQLFGYESSGPSDAPLMLAWRDGPVLDVEVSGDRPNRVGEGLFVMPLNVSLGAQQVFGDQVMRRTIVETTAAQGWGEFNNYYLGRGTMTIEARPISLGGTFRTSSLEIALTQGDVRRLTGNGEPLAPLPESEQPDQEDPVGDGTTDPLPNGGGPDQGNGGVPKPEPAPFFDSLPAFQLFDRHGQRWVEFPQPGPAASYLIDDPQRYVDDSGGILFRFVNRADGGEFGEEQVYFNLMLRLEGTIE